MIETIRRSDSPSVWRHRGICSFCVRLTVKMLLVLLIHILMLNANNNPHGLLVRCYLFNLKIFYTNRVIKKWARNLILTHIFSYKVAISLYKLCMYQTSTTPATSAKYGSTPALLYVVESSSEIYKSSSICLGKLPLS